MEITEEFKKDLILLGTHIEKLRKERKITIKEIAQRTGLRTQYIRKIEQGTAYGVLLDKHLAKISTALEIKMSVLFDFKNKMLMGRLELPQLSPHAPQACVSTIPPRQHKTALYLS